MSVVCRPSPKFFFPFSFFRAIFSLIILTNLVHKRKKKKQREKKQHSCTNKYNFSGTYITEIETVSPLGMSKSPLTKVDNSYTDWMVNVSWTQSFNTSANNDFCFTAYDSTG